MADAPIFIVGSPRSGTGLLRDLLRSHSRLSFPPESHFIPALYRAYGDPGTAREARRLAAAILDGSAVRAWELQLEPTDLDSHRSFVALAAEPYRAWADREGKPRWGDKTPAYLPEIPLLARLFDDAQFVHIVRDGRDVTLSQLGMSAWGPTNVVRAAEQWRSRVEGARGAGRELAPGRYCEIQYEQLATSPERTLREVCGFLGEEFEPGMLRPSRLPRWSARHPNLSPSAWFREGYRYHVNSGSVGRWRVEMEPRDVARFEAVAADQLVELGYPLGTDATPLGPIPRLAWKTDDLIRRTVRMLRSPGRIREETARRLAYTGAHLRRRLRASRPAGRARASSRDRSAREAPSKQKS
ncbi:MAG: sulfotransferase family protein [Solirubrobacterales bacterium]